MVKKAKAAALSGLAIQRRKSQRSVGFVLPDQPNPDQPNPGRPDEELARRRARLPNPDAAPASNRSAVPPLRAISREMEEAVRHRSAGLHEKGGPVDRVVPFGGGVAGPSVTVERYRRSQAEQPAVAASDKTDDAASLGDSQVAEGAQRLVQALRAGDISAAEVIFGEMTKLQPVAVLRVLYAPDAEDLALACRALGLEQLQFVSIFIMTRKLGLGEEALDPRALARIVALFEATDPQEARKALTRWREREAC